ncbi:THAP-type domain-containing protein, partial [Aphis craccivora]
MASNHQHQIFASFPKNEDRKQLWLKACKIKFILPSNKVCEDHFLPENYVLNRNLKSNAIPFLASTSLDLEPLNHYGTFTTCMSPMERSSVQSIACTSTVLEPLNHYGNFVVANTSPVECSSVQPLVSTSKDTDQSDPMITYTMNSSTCQSPVAHRESLNPTTGNLLPNYLKQLDSFNDKLKEAQANIYYQKKLNRMMEKYTSLKKEFKRLKKEYKIKIKENKRKNKESKRQDKIIKRQNKEVKRQ